MNADSIDICQQLETWYRRPAGEYLRQQEQVLVEKLLEQVFGYHLLQIGITRDQPLGLDTGLNHHIYLGSSTHGNVGLVSRADALPLASESMDAVVLHHAVDFAEKPHQLLREVQRVLTPRGRLIIVGFNPWSLPGLARGVRRLLPGRLWRGNNRLSVHRLRDWLHLLGCELEGIRYSYAVPPVGREGLRKHLVKLDQFSTRHNLFLGGVYVLRAQKHVLPLTPMRQRRELNVGRKLIGLNVAKPFPSPRGRDSSA